MHLSACEAVVLSSVDYRESDRIVTLFTREHGKLKGIARNAKRSRKRFGGALETFARLRLQIRLRDSLSGIDDAEIITIFPKIRENLTAIGYAGYACELIDRLTPEGLGYPRAYRLLVAYLDRLDSSRPGPDDRRFFEINLLNIIGYRPLLDSCNRCGKRLTVTGSTFSATGELLCGSCTGGETITVETVSILKQYLETGRFGAVDLTQSQLKEAGGFLDSIITSLLSRPLKSKLFLQEALHLEAG
jgi:DNA repair protein RecO (recombination protein O)